MRSGGELTTGVGASLRSVLTPGHAPGSALLRRQSTVRPDRKAGVWIPAWLCRYHSSSSRIAAAWELPAAANRASSSRSSRSEASSQAVLEAKGEAVEAGGDDSWTLTIVHGRALEVATDPAPFRRLSPHAGAGVVGTVQWTLPRPTEAFATCCVHCCTVRGRVKAGQSRAQRANARAAGWTPPCPELCDRPARASAPTGTLRAWRSTDRST